MCFVVNAVADFDYDIYIILSNTTVQSLWRINKNTKSDQLGSV